MYKIQFKALFPADEHSWRSDSLIFGEKSGNWPLILPLITGEPRLQQREAGSLEIHNFLACVPEITRSWAANRYYREEQVLYSKTFEKL